MYTTTPRRVCQWAKSKIRGSQPFNFSTFQPFKKVSVVRREQIRVLIETAPLPGHPRCGRPLVGGYAQTAPLPGHPLRGLATLGGYAQGAAQTAAKSNHIPPSIYCKTYTEGSDPFVPKAVTQTGRSGSSVSQYTARRKRTSDATKHHWWQTPAARVPRRPFSGRRR